jgi:phenylalanyl-tRNA synthetase beta chain
MKFSENWLREWVNPDLDRDALVEQLTMAGLEVDGVEAAAADLDKVVVGEVLTMEQHPGADRLKVCLVAIGTDRPVTIVCGAPNVRVGIKAPAALIGAVLAGGMKIKRSKLRGVVSEGMLCGTAELGMTEDADGLFDLPADASVGSAISDYLKLDDGLIDIDLTPNRGDCLGIAGIAREVGALNRVPVTVPMMDPVAASIDDRFPLEVSAPEACPRYVGRVIRDIDPDAVTPLWMQERLRRSGVRSLGPLVDVTNYVMLELGQPMHAFDLDQLSGGITVRLAAPGETLTLLDGKELDLDADTLVIADQDKVLALAGIMGGLYSGVADSTRHLFLESAFFAPLAIVGRARRYGLQTDSSYRFERGVDPALQARAIERATGLLLDIVGGKAGPLIEAGSAPEAAAPITLRSSRLQRVLGVEVPAGEVSDTLERLGMGVTVVDDGWQVVAPSYRFDIAIEADLVEEVARTYGYDRIPDSPPLVRMAMPPQPEARLPLSRLRQALVANGYQEVVTYSFVEPELQDALDPESRTVSLANPLSAELSVMRTSIWPGLVQTLRYNLNRQQDRLRLFETGLVFRPGAGEGVAGIDQHAQIGGVLVGDRLPQQWGSPARKVDFFDLKGDVEALLAIGGEAEAYRFEAAQHPALHPGQCARVLRDGEPIGWLGALHPALEQRLDLPTGVFLFELNLNPLQSTRIPAFAALSRFPGRRRDLALLVSDQVPSDRVMDCIRASVGDLLAELNLFDVYTGKGIEPGYKSLALGLGLQAGDHTLEDTEVETVIGELMTRLEAETGAVLRD